MMKGEMEVERGRMTIGPGRREKKKMVG